MKSETRRPKAERSPKSESRRPKEGQQPHAELAYLHFGYGKGALIRAVGSPSFSKRCFRKRRVPRRLAVPFGLRTTAFLSPRCRLAQRVGLRISAFGLLPALPRTSKLDHAKYTTCWGRARPANTSRSGVGGDLGVFYPQFATVALLCGVAHGDANGTGKRLNPAGALTIATH